MGQIAKDNRDDLWWWRWHPPLLLLLCSVCIALLGDGLAELLQYQRDAILSGQWWRLFSGHLVHLGWSHLWLNMAGLTLVWALVGEAFTPRQWWWLITFSMLGISSGLLWWLPGVMWYVGLSGLLHGMLLAGILQLLLRGEREVWPLLLLVLAKLLWELWSGPLPGSREAAGGEVLVEAHSLGALCGAVYCAVLRLSARLHRTTMA